MVAFLKQERRRQGRREKRFHAEGRERNEKKMKLAKEMALLIFYNHKKIVIIIIGIIKLNLKFCQPLLFIKISNK